MRRTRGGGSSKGGRARSGLRDGGGNSRGGSGSSDARKGHGASASRGKGVASARAKSATGAEDASRHASRAARTRLVQKLLEGIGTPEASTFRPDDFQLEALGALASDDVLVTAPTGSGKTWIAREEIRRLLAAGKRAWYTSPLKALTNSKYHEFIAEFGAEQVGILTGDRKERSDAPLIVGTTEVYRNQLFDALRGGEEVNADLVVFDEAHYLSDRDRGHVWEEAIILTPPRVRLLLLSATVGRAEEFAEWIGEVRGTRVRVVSRPGARPVPLRAAFLFPDGELTPLLDEQGRYNTELARFMQAARDERQSQGHGRFYGRGSAPQRRAGMPEMPPSSLLASLGSYDLLPAIVFLPTRRRCDEAATEAAFAPRHHAGGDAFARREARLALLSELAAQYPEVRQHRHWEVTVRGGVASHHAGHLPAWKLAIESLMSAGLLDAIFATATVAAGVDFPARTVVLENIDVRRGQGWQSLTASELQQMTGRAGRRGRDRVGFIVAAPGPHQDPQKMAALLTAPPDPLESQFRATYTTLLNLLDAYGTFAQVRDIAERSFARRDTLEDIARLERERADAETLIDEKLQASHCGLTIDAARGLERLTSARARLLEHAPRTRADVWTRWLDKEVVPGRIVGIGRGSRRLVFVTERRGDGLAGEREDGRRTTLALERIGRVFAEHYPLAEERRDETFDNVREGRATVLPEPRLRDARTPTDEAVALINDLIDKLSAARVEAEDDEAETQRREKALWSVIKEAEIIERMSRRIEAVRDEAWQPFERRARVLDHFGYLDFFAERVTGRGQWLADLRTDRPLLIGEAIERGLFSALDARRTAAVMAALASDADRDYGELELDDALVEALSRFEQIAYEVASVEWRQELEPAPEINFSAAAAAARWAGGVTWATLVRETRAEEGDLFRMLSRTGEALMQIAGLRESHPQAARIAASAASAILREPVRSEAVV